jgi:glycerol-3-phosphate dehydrogenase
MLLDEFGGDISKVPQDRAIKFAFTLKNRDDHLK